MARALITMHATTNLVHIFRKGLNLDRPRVMLPVTMALMLAATLPAKVTYCFLLQVCPRSVRDSRHDPYILTHDGRDLCRHSLRSLSSAFSVPSVVVNRSPSPWTPRSSADFALPSASPARDPPRSPSLVAAPGLMLSCGVAACARATVPRSRAASPCSMRRTSQ